MNLKAEFSSSAFCGEEKKMKNFCPNCGTPLKPGAEFCPNCGTKIKKKPNMTQPAPAPMSPKKPKKNNNVKIIVGALVAIVTICAVIFVVIYHNESSNMQNETKSAMTHKSKKKVKKNTDQSAPSNSSQNSSDSENYSNDEWMLMGYMAYAYDNYVESDNISNNSELVDAVQDDLSNGDLEVKKNSDTTYTLTNKYGSVDATVTSDNVEVSNDGDTTTAKSELEKKFSSYKDQIQKMTSYIKNGSSDEDSSDSDSDNSTKSESQNFTDEQYVAAAFLSAKAKETSPKAEITRVEKLLAKGYDVSRDDYLSGMKNPEDDYYYIAFNASTSQYERYTIKSDYVLAQSHSAGVAGKKYKYNFDQLATDFGPYKNDLNKIIAGIKYNKNHLSEFNDKLRERGE